MAWRRWPFAVLVCLSAVLGACANRLTLALKERPETRVFGEPTAGLTTVNNYFPLSDGSVLNLPTELMGDRHGIAPRGSVIPHERIEGGAWPTVDDAVAARSAEWIADRSELPN